MLLNEAIVRWALEKPDNIAFRYISDRHKNPEELTYLQLFQKAKQLSIFLNQNVRTSKITNCRVVILLFPSGLDFIIAFIACLLSGVVSIPTPVPRKSNTKSRLINIYQHSQSSLVLTNTNVLNSLSDETRSMIKDNFVTTDTIFNEKTIVEDDLYKVDTCSEEVVFLQYTSGTTDRPKGVMVSHQNILSNLSMLQKALHVCDDSIFVSWLPLYHDMGLIGNILLPLYSGRPCTFISPVTFVKQPKLWLELITKYRATITGAPNFAYDLCVQHVSESDKKSLDLSSLSIAYNGAEPINPHTLIRFSEYFSSCGFKDSAFFPCYGLAEATLFVAGHHNYLSTIPVLTDMIGDDKKLVSTGRPTLDMDIRIVSPLFEECPENIEGEIWLSGSNITQGYWLDEHTTKEVFQATLKTSAKKYLRTGDLGFINDQGNLFITGRVKDLIIIHGKKHHPQQLEITASQASSAIKHNGVAAFATKNDGVNQELILLVEVNRNHLRTAIYEEISNRIRSAIFHEYELKIDKIFYFKPYKIPRTSSGKIQRSLCRYLYERNKLEYIDSSQTPIRINQSANSFFQHPLIALISKTLKIPTSQIKDDSSLVMLGIDSLSAILIHHELENTYHQNISIETLLGANSLKELVSFFDFNAMLPAASD